MDMTAYWLPDGRIVQVDATAAKNAVLITFQLEGGRLTTAVRADVLGLESRLAKMETER